MWLVKWGSNVSWEISKGLGLVIFGDLRRDLKSLMSSYPILSLFSVKVFCLGKCLSLLLRPPPCSGSKINFPRMASGFAIFSFESEESLHLLEPFLRRMVGSGNCYFGKVISYWQIVGRNSCSLKFVIFWFSLSTDFPNVKGEVISNEKGELFIVSLLWFVDYRVISVRVLVPCFCICRKLPKSHTWSFISDWLNSEISLYSFLWRDYRNLGGEISSKESSF